MSWERRYIEGFEGWIVDSERGDKPRDCPEDNSFIRGEGGGLRTEGDERTYRKKRMMMMMMVQFRSQNFQGRLC